MRAKIVSALISLVFSFNLSADEKLLRFVTEASYPPFESFNEEQQIVGFDADLVMALCEQIERQCEIYHQPFDSLIPSVASGHYDAAISALDITEQREQVVAFTQPYMENQAVFLLPDAQAERGLPSHAVVGVQVGSALQAYLREQRPELLAIPYASYQSALGDLDQQHIDAVFIDEAAAYVWLNEHPDFTLVETQGYPSKGLGIAVNKSNAELLEQLNQALQQLQQQGGLSLLFKRHFNQP